MNQKIQNYIKTKTPEIALVGLGILFLLICQRYASIIPVWGDEAQSLQFAAYSWERIYNIFDAHFPTYFFYLKGLVSCFGAENEVLLRLFHALPFAVGLFLGYRILRLLELSPFVSIMALSSAILFPLYTFYATNLRMYSMVYAASMFFFYRMIILVVHYEKASLREWVWFVIASATLLLTDFPGIFIYVVGASAVLVKVFLYRDWSKIFCLLIPFFALLIFLGSILRSIGVVLTWPSKSGSMPTLTDVSISESIKFIFKALRPSFELVSSAQENQFAAIFFPALFTAMLMITLFYFILRIKHQTVYSWLVMVLSFYWIILTPTGHGGVTRALLPCLFFMPVFLVMRVPKLPKLIHRINVVVFSVLLFINIHQVFYPTLRFYSSIPFQDIADNSIQFAKKKRVDTIYLSGNTLNAQAIKYYLEKEIRSKSQSIKLEVIPVNYKTERLNLDRSIFISHLPENGLFINHRELFPKTSYLIENIHNYLKLDTLPYNGLWKKHILSRRGQPYAVMVYYVNKR